MTRIPKEERETALRYDALEEEATVYTLDKALIKKLDGWAIKYPEQVKDVTRYRIVMEEDAKWYTLPKTSIKLERPKKQP